MGGGGGVGSKNHPFLCTTVVSRQYSHPRTLYRKRWEWPRAPANKFFGVTFCARTRWKWPQAPANTFLHFHFWHADALEVAAGPGKHIVACHILRPHALEVAAGQPPPGSLTPKATLPIIS